MTTTLDELGLPQYLPFINERERIKWYTRKAVLEVQEAMARDQLRKATRSRRQGRDLFKPTKRRLPRQEEMERFGALWRWDEALAETLLTHEIREEISNILDVSPDAPTNFEVEEVQEPYEPPRAGQDWSVLYPMRMDDNRFALECHDCKTLACRGWGCTDCIEFICYDCGSSQKHRCFHADGRTLWQVGEELDRVGFDENVDELKGISVERVRAIEAQALRQLRTKYRRLEEDSVSRLVKMQLDAFFRYDDELDRITCYLLNFESVNLGTSFVHCREEGCMTRLNRVVHAIGSQGRTLASFHYCQEHGGLLRTEMELGEWLEQLRARGELK